MPEGILLWITGLSGAGKTTIARAVYDEMKLHHQHTVHLDGDNLREILGGSFGYSTDDRKALAWIYARLARDLISQGINVIVSTISLYHEIHDFNRRSNARYFEVLLRASESTLASRRSIYSGASDVVGSSQTPEYPENPSLVLYNDDGNSVSENARQIFKLLGAPYEQ